MVREPEFQLTKRDHAILQSMYDQHRGRQGPFTRLLEYKLHASTLSDNDAPEAAALDSCIAYSINGIAAGPHILVHGITATGNAKTLSVGTIHGLALLGLSEGMTITIDLGGGATEKLHVESILTRPQMPAPAQQNKSAPASGAVLHFRPRAAAAPCPPAPEDDDPGPRAA